MSAIATKLLLKIVLIILPMVVPEIGALLRDAFRLARSTLVKKADELPALETGGDRHEWVVEQLDHEMPETTLLPQVREATINFAAKLAYDSQPAP